MKVRFPLPALAGMCLLTVGCATQQQTASLQCGAGGAAIGFTACMLMGHSAERCSVIAAAGAGIGAIACYSYAGQLDKRRQALAGREDDLNARLVYVRGLNDDAERLNGELSERVLAATKRSDELLAQVQAKRASAERLAAERTHLDEELKEANKQVALQRGAAVEMKAYQAKQSTPSKNLDEQIAKQDRLLVDTQRQLEALASVRERVSRV